MTTRLTTLKTAAGSSSRGARRPLFLLVGLSLLLMLPTATLAQRKAMPRP